MVSHLKEAILFQIHDACIIFFIYYYFLWLCSPTQAMASCGSAAQRGLWPPAALQPNAGYGLLWLCSLTQAMASSSTRFLDHIQRRATVGSTPLDEWSARRRDLYLTTHNNNAPGVIRTHDRRRRAAVDLRLRPCINLEPINRQWQFRTTCNTQIFVTNI
jgi:hypothetical protein